MIPAVLRIRLLAALSVTVAAATLAGCGGASPGQAAAQTACKAYANTMRHQVATTVEQADAIRATARSNARRAADADPEWQPLQRDIEDFYSRQSALSLQTAVNEMNAYFAADRRVQADCKSAGEDIGSLRP
jgi:hypothetical protein